MVHRVGFLFFIVFMFFSGLQNKLQAQDTLLLMNGQVLNCHIIGDSGTVFIFELTKRNGKIKIREIHKNEVFSITKFGENEVVLYVEDPPMGNIYTVDEMRFYMAGERDARNNFTAWPTFFAGFIICGTIGFIGQDGFITAMAPPLAYTLAQLIPKIKIRESTMSNLDYKYNDLYADGYEPTARSRKLLRGMEGSFAGSATGILLWLLTKK
jgi:hypothetical protein